MPVTPPRTYALPSSRRRHGHVREVVAIPECRPRRDGQDETRFDEIRRQQESKCRIGWEDLLARCASVGNRIKQRWRPEGAAVPRGVAEAVDRVEMVAGRVALVAIESVARILACRSAMMRSRVTLARIDAAAIAVDRRSPPTIGRCGMSRSGMRKPSTRTNPGSGTSAITASRIALSDARWMLMRSISSGSMIATCQAPSGLDDLVEEALAVGGGQDLRVGDARRRIVGLQDDGARPRPGPARQPAARLHRRPPRARSRAAGTRSRRVRDAAGRA